MRRFSFQFPIEKCKDFCLKARSQWVSACLATDNQPPGAQRPKSLKPGRIFLSRVRACLRRSARCWEKKTEVLLVLKSWIKKSEVPRQVESWAKKS
ncbi:hypothetical protein PoB_003123400 [Plakobranchus ocellatus]|uniref:Uncharacterized protein n=1 Tax=Plakobranchus ocellatus TaxID=259542 RepID=A0AAV4AAR3_9GAST|nr:hypothetical protein PoB_003123400 [Plakobranchus ocellatus]